MKKILLSVVCLVMVGMQSVKAQVGIVALHHEGNVTVFGEDKLANAIEAAVEGDTIYLSEGHFLNDVTINKPIHLVGSGQGTLIDGDVTISIDNTPTLTGYMLMGMRINGDIIPEKSLNGLRISQCYFNNYGSTRSGSSSGAITVKDFYIEKSYCKDVFRLNELEDGNLYSCKIREVYSSGNISNSTLNHCNIWTFSQQTNNYGFFAINCIFNNFISYVHNSFQNCLFKTSSTLPSSAENCWKTTDSVLANGLDCTMSDQELQAAGYIATDGTVVGITGGDAPYTLNLITPRVLEHNIVVDKENKKVNVTLTVGTE